MSGFKFIAETISLNSLFAAWIRKQQHATVTGSNLSVLVRLTHMLLQKHEHGDCVEMCPDVILATCSGRRGIYDTQISADHSSHFRAGVIHT